ncbi:MAG: sulfate ABC transporter permease [Flavobacteriales bacterium CG_4_9_14_3_um_filter_40_17]|nr:MAG: sulfate ABC transporter permease [Flavobacteriales bacterium CG_4_9_14_3_um_filter_40_17]
MKNSKLLKGLFIAIVVLPVASGLVYAFLFSLGIIGVLNAGFDWDAWQTVLFDKPFWTSFGFSLYIALLSVGISLSFALSIALSWQKKLQKGLLSSVIYLPLCFPATVMAFFSFQLLAKSGLLARIGYQLGFIQDINDFPVLVKDAYGMGIIFTSVLLITPFFIILFSNLYQSEKIASYVNLAKTFGASNGQILRKVIVPILLKRASITIYLFVIFVMGSYEVPLLLGRQNPQMISVAVLQKIQRFNLYDMPQGYAMSLLYVFLVVAILWVLYFKNPQFFKTQNN